MEPLPTKLVDGTRVVTSTPPRADASTIVLVHGMGGTLDFWSAVAPPLMKSYRIVAFDIPGFGVSVAPKVYNLETVAEAVGALLDRLEVRNATVIGHSLGCLLVLELAKVRPDLVSQVVLIDPVLFTIERILTKPVAVIQHPLITLQLAGLFVAVAMPSSVSMFVARARPLKRLLLRPFFVEPEHIPTRLLTIAFSHLGGSSAKYIVKVIPAAKLVGVRKLVSQSAVPLSLIHGDRDPLLPGADLAELRNLVSLIDDQTIERSGHAPLIDRPDETVRAIEAAMDGFRT